MQRFGHATVVVTNSTAPAALAAVQAFDSLELVAEDVNNAGLHRRRAVELALQYPDERILYMDLDHLLR